MVLPLCAVYTVDIILGKHFGTKQTSASRHSWCVQVEITILNIFKWMPVGYKFKRKDVTFTKITILKTI